MDIFWNCTISRSVGVGVIEKKEPIDLQIIPMDLMDIL